MPDKRLLLVLILVYLIQGALHAEPPVVHSRIGQSAITADSMLRITCIGKKQQFSLRDTATLDRDVLSPKSVSFHPDGSRYYVNSLEGCRTVVYQAATNRKLRVIAHRFDSGTGPLWLQPSGFYPFTHYPNADRRPFSGKPVESTFVGDGGRYLLVPYYRRTFDINAQDPSALAVIDTRTDSIVTMIETGPLPKMVATSPDGHLVAITHWGNNTVGLLDTSDPDPHRWHHTAPIIVEHQLALNYSLTSPVNRDAHSGLMLRGTVFTPDGRYLLVGCMGGEGIAVIDLKARQYIGRIVGLSNVRHLIVRRQWLLASINAAGLVMRVPLDSVYAAIGRRTSRMHVGGWQTCRVAPGARTIEASPSGRYVFAACNSASAICVVDTRTMREVTRIAVDSYPVGLDISHDGTMLVVTSQARSGLGGNAVGLYRVDYAEAETPDTVAPPHNDGPHTESADSLAGKINQETPSKSAFAWLGQDGHAALTGTIAVIILLLAVFIVIHRRQ